MNEQKTTTAGTAGADGFNAAAYKEKLESMSLNRMFEEFADRQAETFLTALKDGKLPCQPDGRGNCDMYPAKNLASGNIYKDVNQIMLKLEQRRNGNLTSEYVTLEAAQRAFAYNNKQGAPLLKEGAEAVVIMVYDKAEKKHGFVKLYNIQQITDPFAVREHAVIEEKRRQDEMRKNMESAGLKYYEPGRELKPGSNGVIMCKSTEPVAYLGQWKTAMAAHKDFRVTREQSESFTKACTEYIEKSPNRANALTRLVFDSNNYCKKHLKTLFQKKESPDRPAAAYDPGMGR